MDAFRFPQRNGSTQCFAIYCQVNTASLTLSGSGGLSKKVPNDLFDFAGLHPMAENSAPRTVMGHALSFDVEEVTQFVAAQLSPMSHRATTILPSQFCEHANHEQAGQWIAYSS